MESIESNTNRNESLPMIASSKLDLNSKHIKSYSTKLNLELAMHKAGCLNIPHIVACNESGRYVAIFLGAEAVQLAVIRNLPGCAVHF